MSRSYEKCCIVMKTKGYSWKLKSNVVPFLKNRTVTKDLKTRPLIFILNVPLDLTITGLVWTVSNRYSHSFFIFQGPNLAYLQLV